MRRPGPAASISCARSTHRASSATGRTRRATPSSRAKRRPARSCSSVCTRTCSRGSRARVRPTCTSSHRARTSPPRVTASTTTAPTSACSSAASTNSWREPGGRPTRSWSRTATTARGGPQCEKRRRADDHLCYVAGISTHRSSRCASSRSTRSRRWRCSRTCPSPRAAHAMRWFASASRRGSSCAAATPTRRITSSSSPSMPSTALRCCPSRRPDDIFLDFEGDHFSEQGVQEYLLGYVTSRRGRRARLYGALGEDAHGGARRVRAFHGSRDRGHATRNPAAHIYHFAPYEPAALKRLMGRYATREVELDQLLRGRAFVDLHAVVKRALIASVERYSIKDLEPFFGYARAPGPARGECEPAASSSTRSSRRPRDAAMDDAPADRRELQPRGLRVRAAATGLARATARRSACATGTRCRGRSPKAATRPRRSASSTARCSGCATGLLEGVPVEPGERSPEQQARFVLAHMMEFHRREDKAALVGVLPPARPRRAMSSRTSAAPSSGLEFRKSLERTRPRRCSATRFRHQELDAREG